ncbi:MAG TPA: hypothetical protein VKW77_09860, partial [Acidimicrobiales bacterium]|nr:hypothetical protein [Acidimicrobiales bacterium]
AITLQSAAGMTCSGRAGVCYKPPSGQGFEDMESEVVKLLGMDGTTLRKVADSFGYQWLVLEDADIEALVTQVHMVNSSLADAGWGPQLLCSVFGLCRLEDPSSSGGEGSAGAGTEGGEGGGEPTVGPGRVRPSSSFLVYLFKRGTFYPFVPTGSEKRDTEEELRLRSLVADDLKVEADLARWFPLWDLPVG